MNNLVKRYLGETRWSVGGLFAHDNILWNLFDVMREVKIPNPIWYVFGSIPCKFAGGRICPQTATIENCYKTFDIYIKFGVGLRLTFSNTDINEEDLDDEICNKLLGYLNEHPSNNKHGVIVSSDLLARYIKENYPNLEIISSLVKPSVEVGLGQDKDTAEYYNKLFDLYDLVVVNPTKIGDMNFWNNIKHPERLEFITNHHCVPDCPMAGKHYKTTNKINIALASGENVDDAIKEFSDINDYCIEVRRKYPFAGTSYGYDAINALILKGVRNFKVEGREAEEVTLLRDLGDYIFNYHIFTRVANAFMGKVI